MKTRLTHYVLHGISSNLVVDEQGRSVKKYHRFVDLYKLLVWGFTYRYGLDAVAVSKRTGLDIKHSEKYATAYLKMIGWYRGGLHKTNEVPSESTRAKVDKIGRLTKLVENYVRLRRLQERIH